MSALWEGGWDVFFFLKFPEDGEEVALESEEGTLSGGEGY